MKTLKRLLPLILAVLLIISAAANYLLFSAAQTYYAGMQTIRFNPLGLNAYADPPPAKQALPRVVFYGDSRAFQWPAPASGRFEFLNRGIGSQTSNQILLRYDAHITPLEPDILIVQMCVNELKTVPIFPTQRPKILQSCQQNIETVIEHAAETDTTVILTTVFPTGQVPLRRRLVWSPDVDVAIQEINRFIRQKEGENVIVFDSYQLLADETGHVNPAYAFDLLHLNTAGYSHLNQALLATLEAIHPTRD